MPVIVMHLIEGRDEEMKRKLAQNITKAVCDTLQKEPSAVRIIFSDMAAHDYAIGGVLFKDK